MAGKRHNLGGSQRCDVLAVELRRRRVVNQLGVAALQRGSPMEPNRWPRDSRTANVVALLAALSLLGACGGGAGTAAQNPSGAPLSANASLPPAVAQAQTDKTAVNPAIVSADNTFGFILFQNLDRGGTANIAISPTSIAVVLQILFNGAAGATQHAMSLTLQLQGFSA